MVQALPSGEHSPRSEVGVQLARRTTKQVAVIIYRSAYLNRVERD